MSIAMEVRLIMVALYLVVGYLKAIMCSLIQITMIITYDSQSLPSCKSARSNNAETPRTTIDYNRSESSASSHQLILPPQQSYKSSPS